MNLCLCVFVGETWSCVRQQFQKLWFYVWLRLFIAWARSLTQHKYFISPTSLQESDVLEVEKSTAQHSQIYRPFTESIAVPSHDHVILLNNSECKNMSGFCSHQGYNQSIQSFNFRFYNWWQIHSCSYFCIMSYLKSAPSTKIQSVAVVH